MGGKVISLCALVSRADTDVLELLRNNRDCDGGKYLTAGVVSPSAKVRSDWWVHEY